MTACCYGGAHPRSFVVPPSTPGHLGQIKAEVACYDSAMEPTPSMPSRTIAIIATCASLGAAVATGLVTWGFHFYDAHVAAQYAAYSPVPENYVPDDSCNALAIQVNGNIVVTRSEVPFQDIMSVQDGKGSYIAPNYSASSDIEYQIQNAVRSRPNIQALILDINSPGGDAEAGQEIAEAIRQSGKPSVAVIRGMGASAGYFVAAATDRIFARENSEVGSIGITSSFLNQYEKDKKDGIVYEQLSSGEYKDTFSPDKPLTDAEKKLIMRDVNLMKDNFVKMLAGFRHMPVEKMDALSDGSTMLGQQGLESGLVDEIGGLKEAESYLEGKLGTPVSICWQ